MGWIGVGVVTSGDGGGAEVVSSSVGIHAMGSMS